MRILFFAIFFMVSQSAFAKIKVNINYSPIANMVYQIDCISGHLPHCSRKNYQALWDKQFLNNDSDKEAVKAWGELMERYKPELELGDSKNRSVTGRFEGVKLSTKIRIASFQSQEPSDYFNRLDLVVIPTDRTKIEAIVNQFYPKFIKWWNKEPKTKGSPFSKESSKLLKSKKISSKLDDFFHFYAVDLPDDYEVQFNFFYRPDLVEEPTSGQQIENYSTTEFLPKESAADRMDVVIHELCHFFLENSDQKKFSILQKEFINQKDLTSMAAYNLMNESLATAFGNGMINRINKSKQDWEKFQAKEQSFYNNYYIDKAAKALLPFLDQWLSDKKTLYHDSYVKNYVQTLKEAFGDELSAPRLLLTEMVLLGDSDYGNKFRDHVRRAARVSSMYTSEGNWSDERFLSTYNKHKDLNTLLIVYPGNFSKIKKHKLLPANSIKSIETAYSKNKKVIFSYKVDPSTVFYVIAAKDYKNALELVDKLAELKKGFDGILSE